MTLEQNIDAMRRQMNHAGWGHKPSANFGDIYKSRDDVHSVEITRFGEWMLYRYDPRENMSKQIAGGECPAKMFLALVAADASFQGAH
jgi:hypothetical protein